MRLSSTQKSYLAGFLDGDGSIYVRLKPNHTYKYGYQVSPYIVFFQSSKDRQNFEKLCSLMSFGYMRERKDGILEFTIGRREDILTFLKMVKPYVVLKKRQISLMEQILALKEKINDEKDFSELIDLVNSFGNINYSKKRIVRKLVP